VAAALAMQARLSVLNARWAVHGRPELPVGIGLGQGEVFAGYLGSERRLEYSVIGDPVNVAARLCDEAKAGEVLLTDEVARSLTRPVALERVEGIELKGRRRPVGVWRALGPRAQR